MPVKWCRSSELFNSTIVRPLLSPLVGKAVKTRDSYLDDLDDLDSGLLVGRSYSYSPTEILVVTGVDSGMTNGDAGHQIHGQCHTCGWSEFTSGYLKFHYEGSHRPTLIPSPSGHLELRASLTSYGGSYSSTQPTALLSHEEGQEAQTALASSAPSKWTQNAAFKHHHLVTRLNEHRNPVQRLNDSTPATGLSQS